MITNDDIAELARLGSSTVYEADGQGSQIDADFIRVIPGSRAAGPARTVVCGQQDNLMVHAAMAGLQQGEVLVLTMPEAQPHTLIGDLLATQAKVRGAAAILVDGAIRDVDELVRRFVGATSVPIRPDPYLDSITSADPTHGSDDLPRWNEPRGTAAAIGAIAVARLPFPRLPRG